MSYKGTHKIDGFFEYVVPPLEGFWWQDGLKGSIDYNNKNAINFISIIRLPDFVTKEDFDWAIKEATERYHHEIYLSDPRKCDISKLKTVIRHPIKKIKSEI